MIDKSKEQLERMFKILNIKFGAFNVEFIIDRNLFSWRNGGNLIPDAIKHTYNNDTVDLLDYPIEMNKPKGYYSSYLLHSQKDGIVDNIYILLSKIFLSKRMIVSVNLMVQIIHLVLW